MADPPKKPEMFKFPVTCPSCGKQLENTKLGINSYLETCCPYCGVSLWAKSNTIGVKINLMSNDSSD